jgi:hypothetical protein
VSLGGGDADRVSFKSRLRRSRDTIPPFVAGGKSPTQARIMALIALLAVTHDPSFNNDAVTVNATDCVLRPQSVNFDCGR